MEKAELINSWKTQYVLGVIDVCSESLLPPKFVELNFSVRLITDQQVAVKPNCFCRAWT